MNGKWHEIWSRRGGDGEFGIDLQALIDLDGFDSGAGKISASDWRTYARSIAASLGIEPGTSVYELGCGSGALLYALRELGAEVGGADYAEGLVDVARTVFPGQRIDHVDALRVGVSPPYDFVISNSVFHYFPSDEYARTVIDAMLAKALRAVAIFEVPDAWHREESEAARRAALSPEEYARKYAGLEHRYYERRWFEKIAGEIGYDCEIRDQSIPNYAQNRFRFNCILRKRR